MEKILTLNWSWTKLPEISFLAQKLYATLTLYEELIFSNFSYPNKMGVVIFTTNKQEFLRLQCLIAYT